MACPGSDWLLLSFCPFPVRHPGDDHGICLIPDSYLGHISIHRSFVGSNVCLEFVYSGCGTSENVFGAEKECRQKCGDRKGDDDYAMGDGDVYLI